PIIVKAPDDAVLGTVLDRRFDVRRAALFDTSAAVAGVPNVTALPEPLGIAASVTRYAPGSVAVRLAAPAPKGSALIVSENYYPGWRATVGGKPAVTGRADYTLIGVQLPEGATAVDLTFTSPAYQKGKFITLIAIAVALIVAGVGFVAERRKVA
ncbi:MAG: YfhO family protein, partial [Armatimonadetes bacterium]|nr:YfhO family protein [Armatimonadota bacterium]